MGDKPRIFNTPWFEIYPMYVAKAQHKGRTEQEVDKIITWLTSYSVNEIHKTSATVEEFFTQAKINENVGLIKGKVCGIEVSEIADPTMQKIRWLDKLVDELAKGKTIDKILRKQ